MKKAPILCFDTCEVVYCYRQYLKTRHWRNIQFWFRGNLPPVCFRCGRVHNLNIHHRTYGRVGQELMSDLIYLCEMCHKVTHAEIKFDRQIELQQRKMLKQMRNMIKSLFHKGRRR